jgi:hypothetical protein
MTRQLLVPALFILAFSVAAPAGAQWGRPDPRPSYGSGPYSEVRRIAFDRGYREGVIEGEKDGRSRDAFRYQDEGDYRNGDVGYHRSYGDREFYRQAFRAGFADGYADGYRRYARGAYGSDRYDPRYGGGYGYPGGSYGYPGRDDRYLTPFDIGARDGFEKGRDDVRDRRAYDARRHKWYREGDRDYNDRYGNRERYKDEYRRGFLAGYERGFRNLR